MHCGYTRLNLYVLAGAEHLIWRTRLSVDAFGDEGLNWT